MKKKFDLKSRLFDFCHIVVFGVMLGWIGWLLEIDDVVYKRRIESSKEHE